MALENLVGADKFIAALVPSNPTGGDDKREGDDHIRGLKNTLKNTFPNLNAAVTATPAQLNDVTQIPDKVNRSGDTMTGALAVQSTIHANGYVDVAGNRLRANAGYAGPGGPFELYDTPVGVGTGGGRLVLISGHGADGFAMIALYLLAIRNGTGVGPELTPVLVSRAGSPVPGFTFSVVAGKVCFSIDGPSFTNVQVFGL